MNKTELLALADGPQPVKAPDRLTCTGCSYLTTEKWREYMYEDDEWDNGTHARCAAAEGGRHITSYWRENSAPPSWCPRAKAGAQ